MAKRKRRSMTPNAFFEMLAKKYGEQPNDYVVSIGHWKPDDIGNSQLQQYGVPPERCVLKEFVADIKLTVGGIKKMLDPDYPYEEMM